MKICDRCTATGIYECLYGEVHGATFDLCKSCFEEFDAFLKPPEPEAKSGDQREYESPTPTPRKGVRTYGKRS